MTQKQDKTRFKPESTSSVGESKENSSNDISADRAITFLRSYLQVNGGRKLNVILPQNGGTSVNEIVNQGNKNAALQNAVTEEIRNNEEKKTQS